MKKISILLIVLVAASCQKEQKISTVKLQEVISEDSATLISAELKKVLVSQLTAKIGESGTAEAVTFCNIEALPLTKSVADKHGISVSRVSDQPRNQTNKASATEIEIIEKYKNLLKEKQQLQPTTENGFLYDPLVTNAMCLQCHGVPGKNIKPEVSAKLAALYPEDLATGYKENQIRGLVKVQLGK